MRTNFEWDDAKNKANFEKHGLRFESAQYAFADPNRVILEDLNHGVDEVRYYCIGKIDDGIVTVRFTYRESKIRIFGAGLWRRGKEVYEATNQL